MFRNINYLPTYTISSPEVSPLKRTRGTISSPETSPQKRTRGRGPPLPSNIR
jgi:hypothetical protein